MGYGRRTVRLPGPLGFQPCNVGCDLFQRYGSHVATRQPVFELPLDHPPAGQPPGQA